MNKEKHINESKILERQIQLYGLRYEGASLSKINLQNHYQESLNRFIKKPTNMLIYIGNPGIGKTYFCAALTDWAINNFRSFRYHKERDILSTLRNNMQNFNGGDYTLMLELLIDDDLIILDDLGSSGVNEWREEVFFNFLDHRYNSMKPTIITSNFSKKEVFEKYSKRVGSRMFASENTILEIHKGADLRESGL